MFQTTMIRPQFQKLLHHENGQWPPRKVAVYRIVTIQHQNNMLLDFLGWYFSMCGCVELKFSHPTCHPPTFLWNYCQRHLLAATLLQGLCIISLLCNVACLSKYTGGAPVERPPGRVFSRNTSSAWKGGKWLVLFLIRRKIWKRNGINLNIFEQCGTPSSMAGKKQSPFAPLAQIAHGTSASGSCH
jgi:hypothetical protein